MRTQETIGLLIADHKALFDKLPVPMAIFLVALLPRALTLGTFISFDDGLWLARSMNFYIALGHLNLLNTFQTTHPGVTTMWISGIFITIYNTLVQYHLITYDFGSLLAMGSFPIALVTSIAVAVAYYLLKQIFNDEVALLSALLIALDPFFIANSRVVHLDALLAVFMTLTMLSLLVYLKNPKKQYLALSGTFMGLAILTKLPAIFLIPFTILMVAIWHAPETRAGIKGLINKDTALRSAKIIAALLAISALVFILLWPTMWVNPIGTISKITGTINHAVAETEPPAYFLGESPGHDLTFYYVFVLLMRTTPIVLIFSIASMLLLGASLVKRRFTSREKAILMLALFVVLFVVQMTLAVKKGNRYILPVFLPVDILAALGICGALRMAAGAIPDKFRVIKSRKAGAILVAAALVLIQVIPLIFIHPYYLAYYNPIVLGGPAHAPEYLMVGRGEGMDQSIKYLNSLPDAKNLTVASGFSEVQNYFKGSIVPMSQANSSDYILFYISDIQSGENSDLWDQYKNSPPEQVVTINDIDYCWVYKTKKS